MFNISYIHIWVWLREVLKLPGLSVFYLKGRFPAAARISRDWIWGHFIVTVIEDKLAMSFRGAFNSFRLEMSSFGLSSSEFTRVTAVYDTVEQ